MPERQRARYEGQIVTIIEGKLGRRGNVQIRNGFGFIETVPAKELERIDPNEPEAVLKFGETTD